MKVESEFSKQAWARSLNSRSKIQTEAFKDPGIHREFRGQIQPRVDLEGRHRNSEKHGKGLVFKSDLHVTTRLPLVLSFRAYVCVYTVKNQDMHLASSLNCTK